MNYNNTHNDGINYMDQFKYPINLQKYSSKRNNNDKARCALPEVWLHSTTTIKCNVKTSITVTVMAVIASMQWGCTQRVTPAMQCHNKCEEANNNEWHTIQLHLTTSRVLIFSKYVHVCVCVTVLTLSAEQFSKCLNFPAMHLFEFFLLFLGAVELATYQKIYIHTHASAYLNMCE